MCRDGAVASRLSLPMKSQHPKWSPVQDLAALVFIQLPANLPGRAKDYDPTT